METRKRPLARHHPRRQQKCMGCSKRKASCTHVIPCDRCFSLCTRCEPTAKQPKSTSYVDLVLSTLEPPVLAKELSAALRALWTENRLDRGSFVVYARAWRGMSLMVGKDVTYGVLEEWCEVFNISPEEMDHVGVEYSSGEWAARGQEEGAGGERKGEEVKGGGKVAVKKEPAVPAGMSIVKGERLSECDSFKMLDDGCTAMWVSLPGPAGTMMATNAAAGMLSLSAVDMCRYALQHAILPGLLFASFVAPADRQVYFQSMVSGAVRPVVASSAFVKFCSRDGDIDLYVFRCRLVNFPEFPGLPASVMTLQKAPMSRYITKKPGHRHRILETFRMHTQHAKAETARKAMMTAAPAGQGPFYMPGIACLPLPPFLAESVGANIEIFTLPPGSDRLQTTVPSNSPSPPLPPPSSCASSIGTSSSCPSSAAGFSIPPQPPSFFRAHTHSAVHVRRTGMSLGGVTYSDGGAHAFAPLIKPEVLEYTPPSSAGPAPRGMEVDMNGWHSHPSLIQQQMQMVQQRCGGGESGQHMEQIHAVAHHTRPPDAAHDDEELEEALRDLLSDEWPWEGGNDGQPGRGVASVGGDCGGGGMGGGGGGGVWTSYANGGAPHIPAYAHASSQPMAWTPACIPTIYSGSAQHHVHDEQPFIPSSPSWARPASQADDPPPIPIPLPLPPPPRPAHHVTSSSPTLWGVTQTAASTDTWPASEVEREVLRQQQFHRQLVQQRNFMPSLPPRPPLRTSSSSSSVASAPDSPELSLLMLPAPRPAVLSSANLPPLPPSHATAGTLRRHWHHYSLKGVGQSSTTTTASASTPPVKEEEPMSC